MNLGSPGHPQWGPRGQVVAYLSPGPRLQYRTLWGGEPIRGSGQGGGVRCWLPAGGQCWAGPAKPGLRGSFAPQPASALVLRLSPLPSSFSSFLSRLSSPLSLLPLPLLTPSLCVHLLSLMSVCLPPPPPAPATTYSLSFLPPSDFFFPGKSSQISEPPRPKTIPQNVLNATPNRIC